MDESATQKPADNPAQDAKNDAHPKAGSCPVRRKNCLKCRALETGLEQKESCLPERKQEADNVYLYHYRTR